MYYLGYVAGVVLTDGCIFDSPQNNGKYTSTVTIASLQCKSMVFARKFADALEALTDRDVVVHPFTRTNFAKSTLVGRRDYVFNGFNIKVKCRKQSKQIRSLMYILKTDPSKVPKHTLKGVVDAIVDADGYYCKEYLDISQKEPAWILKILDAYGIKHRCYFSPSQKVGHIRITLSEIKNHNILSYKIT